MVLFVCAMIFGGPLVVALSAMLLVSTSGIAPVGASQGLIVAAVSLGTASGLGAAGTAALYRWCFDRPPVRGAALLASLVLGLLLLSHEGTLAFLGRAVADGSFAQSNSSVVLGFLVEAGMLVVLSIIVCTVLVLSLEVPLRWINGSTDVISEGAFRMLRWVSVALFFVVTAAFFRGEGLLRLERAVSRALG